MFKFKVHIYFFITSIVILLGGIIISFISEDNNLDINIHDTYYVISNWYITYMLVFIYSFLGILYYLINRLQLKTNTILSYIHTIITCGSVYVYWIVYPILAYLDTSIFSPGYINLLLLILSLLIILAQPLYIINIIIGLIRGRK